MRRLLPRIVLTGLVCAAVLALVFPGIGAGAPRQAGDADGTLAIGRSNTGPLFSAAALEPGTTLRSSIRITNDGTVPGRFRFRATVERGAGLARRLVLHVAVGGRVLYAGSFADFRTADLGILRPGETVAVRLAAKLPRAAADPSLHGATLSATFHWDAAQV
jgi:hypothetical protein